MRYGILVIMILLAPGLYAQTCCTAGAPVSNLYGIQDGADKTWAINLDYEHKSINLLIDDNTRLVNDPRKRSGQSLSAKVDYVLNSKLSFSAIVPLIYQLRETISATENSIGIGDPLLVSQYRLVNKNDYNLSLSGGLKLQFGQRSHRSDNSILLSPDMQSGSGSLDWIARINLTKTHFLRAFLNSSLELSYRNNGINSSFGSTSSFMGRRFGFGNEWVSNLTFNYQWITSKGFYIPDLSLKYRSSDNNNEGRNTAAPNSGGKWLSLPIGVSFKPDEQKSLRFYIELPLYQDLNGLQITTSFTTGLQLRYIFNKDKNNTELIKIL